MKINKLHSLSLFFWGIGPSKPDPCIHSTYHLGALVDPSMVDSSPTLEDAIRKLTIHHISLGETLQAVTPYFSRFLEIAHDQLLF